MYQGALRAPVVSLHAFGLPKHHTYGPVTTCRATPDSPRQQRLHPKPLPLPNRQLSKYSSSSVSSTAFVADVVAPIAGRVREAAAAVTIVAPTPTVDVRQDEVIITAGEERLHIHANGKLQLWRCKCPLVGDDGSDEARCVTNCDVSM